MPVTLVRSKWSSGNLVFYKEGTGAATGIDFGIDGTGIDVTFYGDTASSSMKWDQSADRLVITGGSADLGASCSADAYVVGATSGASFTSGAITSLEVINGIVVYAA